MDPLETIFEDDDMRVEYVVDENVYAVFDKNEERSAMWDYAFGLSPTDLDEVDRLRLPMTAIKMLFKGQKRNTIKGNGYDGYIVNTGKYGFIGSHFGHSFKGEIETDRGKRDIAFLVMQPQNRSSN